MGFCSIVFTTLRLLSIKENQAAGSCSQKTYPDNPDSYREGRKYACIPKRRKRNVGGYSKGDHLFPFRTEKLSPLALMVLPLGGRVGRCQLNTTKPCCFTAARLFFALFISCSTNFNLFFPLYFLIKFNFAVFKTTVMNREQSLYFRLELIWWIFTLILAVGITYPILREVADYPFLVINIIFVIVFVTFTRYIFLLKHTFLAKQQLIKAGIVLVSIPIIFMLVNEINLFQTFLDENGVEGLVGDLPFGKRENIAKFIRAEMLFFGVGSVVSAVIFPFRLVLSIWRTKNKGTV